jgi:PPOX class probable F420-dependent enzyme
MPEEEALRRLVEARVGRFATADAAGIPHVVPFVFVVEGATLYWAVDAKPKRSPRLKRLANIEANPNVEVVVDEYDEDWSQLWWVRASGAASVLSEGDEQGLALRLLASKYPQYVAEPPSGPVVAITLSRVTGWQGGQALDG